MECRSRKRPYEHGEERSKRCNHSERKDGVALILMLERDLLANAVWPEDRVVIGLRVCKDLRRAFLETTGTVALHVSPRTCSAICNLSGDLKTFQRADFAINAPYLCEKQTSAFVSAFRGAISNRVLASHVVRLDLSFCALCDEIILESLATALRQSSSLKHVNLKGNDLTSSHGTVAVLLSLAASPCLQDLNLDGNSLALCCGSLAEMVGALSTTLVSLRISGNRIGRDGMRQLLEEVEQCRRLELLDVSGNNLGCPGLDYCLSRIFSNCQGLKHLNLSGTRISGVPGAQCVSKQLHRCSALKHLNMSYNPLCRGALCVASSLPSSLEALSLRSTALHGDDVAELLLKLWNQCPLLVHLSLSENPLGEDGRIAVHDFAEKCTRLANLHLSQIGEKVDRLA